MIAIMFSEAEKDRVDIYLSKYKRENSEKWKSKFVSDISCFKAIIFIYIFIWVNMTTCQLNMRPKFVWLLAKITQLSWKVAKCQALHIMQLLLMQCRGTFAKLSFQKTDPFDICFVSPEDETRQNQDNICYTQLSGHECFSPAIYI